jgi:hypothetical protein
MDRQRCQRRQKAFPNRGDHIHQWGQVRFQLHRGELSTGIRFPLEMSNEGYPIHIREVDHGLLTAQAEPIVAQRHHVFPALRAWVLQS